MHPREEQLNDYVDAALDTTDDASVSRHLEQCAECALFVAQLQHIVHDAGVLPPVEPPADVWLRIRSELAASPLAALEQRAGNLEQRAASQEHRLWGGKPAWALATAAAVAMAFLAGRVIEQRHQRAAAVQSAATAAPQDRLQQVSSDSTTKVRERVLLVAVGDHLERSQMVLVELANAQTQGELDISSERQWADELLASNRLYRQTAVQLGQTNVAGVLDDLERVLVEVARGPSQVSMRQLAEIQQRIEAQGILFRVKIIGATIGSEVRERERGNSTIAGKKAPVS